MEDLRRAPDFDMQRGNVYFEPTMPLVGPYDTLTPRTTPPLPQSKLRASCDACGEAKIKCDRGQPACGRCIAQGVGCVYGVSRKAGKPPRRRPADHSPLPLPRPSKPEIASLEQTVSGGYDDIDMIFSAAEGSMSLDLESPFSASYATNAFQPNFGFDSLSALGALTPESCLGSGSSDHQHQSLKPVDSPPVFATTAAATTTPPTTASTTGAPRAECTKESKDLMRRLYCANPSDAISDGAAARTLDLGTVLTRNRDVVSRLAMLMRCPCAKSPHMAMLYASIISRVMLWYQQALSNSSNPAAVGTGLAPPSGTPAAVTASSSREATRSPAPKMFDTPGAADADAVAAAATAASASSVTISVLPTPVMVGAFQSDDQSLQTALANRLILSELKKVRCLVETFVSLGTLTATGPTDAQIAAEAPCPAAGEFAHAPADASLFASLGAWLRSEHGRIVWKARSGLFMLNDTISF